MEVDISWGERDPHEAEALRCLVEAGAYLQQARLHGSGKLYSKALEYAEKVIQCLPWSAVAHYISAVAHLEALGDLSYAQQKYKLLQTFKSGEATNLAQTLKNELEKFKAAP